MRDDEIDGLAMAYDRAMDAAESPDKRVGRTSTRVHDLVNRDGAFDAFFQHPPVLAACCQTIRQPFKLSNMLGRTLHGRSGPDEIHVDAAPDHVGWPMLGFIVMIDAFTAENGATRFWPGSHQRVAAGETRPVPEAELVAACGPAGAVVVYNGSVRHGHGPNHTDLPRRSIQGAYIRREAVGFGLPDRTQPETIERLSMLAKYLIAV